jgi:hypothetical protein
VTAVEARLDGWVVGCFIAVLSYIPNMYSTSTKDNKWSTLRWNWC